MQKIMPSNSKIPGEEKSAEKNRGPADTETRAPVCYNSVNSTARRPTESMRQSAAVGAGAAGEVAQYGTVKYPSALQFRLWAGKIRAEVALRKTVQGIPGDGFNDAEETMIDVITRKSADRRRTAFWFPGYKKLAEWCGWKSHTLALRTWKSLTTNNPQTGCRKILDRLAGPQNWWAITGDLTRWPAPRPWLVPGNEQFEFGFIEALPLTNSEFREALQKTHIEMAAALSTEMSPTVTNVTRGDKRAPERQQNLSLRVTSQSDSGLQFPNNGGEMSPTVTGSQPGLKEFKSSPRLKCNLKPSVQARKQASYRLQDGRWRRDLDPFLKIIFWPDEGDCSKWRNAILLDGKRAEVKQMVEMLIERIEQGHLQAIDHPGAYANYLWCDLMRLPALPRRPAGAYAVWESAAACENSAKPPGVG